MMEDMTCYSKKTKEFGLRVVKVGACCCRKSGLHWAREMLFAKDVRGKRQ